MKHSALQVRHEYLIRKHGIPVPSDGLRHGNHRRCADLRTRGDVSDLKVLQNAHTVSVSVYGTVSMRARVFFVTLRPRISIAMWTAPAAIVDVRLPTTCSAPQVVALLQARANQTHKQTHTQTHKHTNTQTHTHTHTQPHWLTYQ